MLNVAILVCNNLLKRYFVMHSFILLCEHVIAWGLGSKTVPNLKSEAGKTNCTD